MKTLQEYILEAMSKDVFLDNVKSMFGINDDDYESAYNVLKSANSTKGLLDELENYIKDETEIKNAGYYLAMLFDLSGLPVKANKQIITSIINDNNVEELNTMIDVLIKNEEKNSLTFDFNENKNRNLLEIFCKNFENLAKYIFNIDYFKKSNNNSGNGKGELLLQLLIGGSKTDVAGDVFLPDEKTLEVKCKNGKLGNSPMKSSNTTDFFINTLKNAGVLKNITYNGSCFGGSKTNKNGVNIFNDFWKNIKLSKNAKINDIFKCYIETIFNKYGYNIEDETELNKLLELNNPFKINDNILKIDISNADFTQLTGFLYLYAYQKISKFDYLIVFDNDLNFKCLNCENILKKYKDKEIAQKFNFTLPGNTDDKSDRSNVAVINLNK